MREGVKLLDSQLSNRLREMISILVDDMILDPSKKSEICNPVIVKDCIMSDNEGRRVRLEVDLFNRSICLYGTGFISHGLYNNILESTRLELIRISEEIIYSFIDEENWEKEQGVILLNFDGEKRPSKEFILIPIVA